MFLRIVDRLDIPTGVPVTNTCPTCGGESFSFIHQKLTHLLKTHIYITHICIYIIMIYNYIYIYFFGENPSDSTFAWQKHHFSPWKFPLSHYSSSFVHSKTMSFPGFTRFLDSFFRGPPEDGAPKNR